MDAQGAFDLGKLKEALHPNLQGELEHGCCLDFIGKTYARKQASAQADTLIVPDVEHNEKPENARSENLFFTGDNLDVLRHLKNNYYNSVDLIYIDPPYNTGSDDFVYPDKFEWSEEDLKEEFGMSDVQIKRLKTLQGRSSHSAWLAFMYPRLFIARQLLKDSGVIFVSIDDNEQAHLKLLLDEVFGEGNFVANIAWRRFNSQSNVGSFAKVKDSILFYAKDSTQITPGRLPLSETAKREYQYKDERGIYARRPCIDSVRGRYVFDFKTPNGTVLHDHWMMTEEDFLRENEQGLIHWPENGGNPMRKMYLKDALKNGQISNDFWDSEYGNNRNATEEIKKLFNDKRMFDFPKPTKLMRYIVNLSGCDENALILDFFAGSGTTADAVMQLNAEDGGKRKFILVQLPEVCKEGSVAKKNGYETIDEITRERVKRSAAKILEEKQSEIFFKADEFDGGFKHFRVKNLPDNYIGNIKSINDAPQMFSTITQCEGGAASILATWMAMDGFKFDVHVKVEEFAGCVANVVEDVLYILEMWSSEATEELINRLGTYDEKLVLRKIVAAEDVLTFEKHLEIKNELKRLKSGSGIEVALEVRN